MASKADITDESIEKATGSARRYCLRLYKAGSKQDQPPEEADRIQMEHLRYLFQLRAQGMVVINGPVIDDPEMKGMAIFNTTDIEEVKQIADRDPAVQAGRLVYEVYHWFGMPGDCLPE